MKTWIFALGLMCSVVLYGQNDCSKYYPFNEGTTTEYESYDKKGKTVAKMKYTVSEVSKSGGATTATINTEFYDKKDELVMTNAFDMNCDGSSVTIDFKSLMNNPGMQQFQNAEATVTGTNLEIPNNLTPGQTLNDANVNIAVDMGGMNMNITTEITDRKVEKTETVTTPAGTFECVVISQSSQAKMMVGKVKTVEKTWLAAGVGMIKTENYNAKGKLQGSMVLTSITK
jgi:hypothetical protein